MYIHMRAYIHTYIHVFKALFQALSVRTGTIYRRLACPLSKDDEHESKMVNVFMTRNQLISFRDSRRGNLRQIRFFRFFRSRPPGKASRLRGYSHDHSAWSEAPRRASIKQDDRGRLSGPVREAWTWRIWRSKLQSWESRKMKLSKW